MALLHPHLACSPAPLSHVWVTRVCRFEALAPPFFRCFLSSPNRPLHQRDRGPHRTWHLATPHIAAHHTHTHTPPPRTHAHTHTTSLNPHTHGTRANRQGGGCRLLLLLDGAAGRRQPQYLSRGGDQVHPSMRPNDGSCPAMLILPRGALAG